MAEFGVTARGLVPGTLNMEQTIVMHLEDGMKPQAIAQKLQVPLNLVTTIEEEYYGSHE